MTIRRRRQCRTCHHRWTTIEAAIDDVVSTTKHKFAAEMAKMQELSEQVLDLKITNGILKAQNNLAYSQPDDRPHFIFVLGTGSGPPYRISITRNADKLRNQYSKPTQTGVKILYQKRQARAVYARIIKQQAYEHFREKGVIGEWIKAPLGEVISAIDNVTAYQKNVLKNGIS
jgi:hypothetical protein